MSRDSQKRKDRARRRRITSHLRAPPPTLRELKADEAEIDLYLAIKRFDRLVGDVKRTIYRKPQNVWKR